MFISINKKIESNQKYIEAKTKVLDNKPFVFFDFLLQNYN